MRASLFLVVAAVGCRSTASAPPATPEDDSAALLATVLEAQRHMHTRYAATQALIDQLTRSDLEGLRATSAIVHATGDPGALPRWQPYIAAVQDAAAEIEHAANLRAAASGTAMLATRCASCHVALEARIQFADEAPKGPGAAPARQMVRHRWAAQQLWQGLIGPSNERWVSGANALLAVRFDVVAQHGLDAYPVDVDDAMWIRTYGRRALAARSNSERADVFGDLMVTCAHCHAGLRGR